MPQIDLTTTRCYSCTCPICHTLNVIGPGGSGPPVALQRCLHFDAFRWDTSAANRTGAYVLSFGDAGDDDAQ